MPHARENHGEFHLSPHRMVSPPDGDEVEFEPPSPKGGGGRGGWVWGPLPPPAPLCHARGMPATTGYSDKRPENPTGPTRKIPPAPNIFSSAPAKESGETSLLPGK